MEIVDLALVMYSAGVVVSLYGFFLFLWWWKKVGSATDVYIFISLLFAANAFSDATAGYARWLKVYSPDQYLTFMDCGVWAWRRVPELIVLIVFVSRMTWRVFDAKRREGRGELLIGQHHNSPNRDEKNRELK